jgi:LysR family transcriptional regulator for bpeEF and oprC
LAINADLNKLQVFREVVLAGSFSKAALQLKQPKSRVSRNIALLEKELGVQLIYRTTRQFQLTQAGKELFQKAAPLLNELNNTLEQMSTEGDEISGSLRVTVSEDIGVELIGKLCHEFMTLFPKVHIGVLASNQYVDLVKESVDVAVRIGKAKDSTMIQKKVGTVDLIFVMSPDLLNRRGNLNKLEELEALPFLAFTPGDLKRYSVKVSNGKETRNLKLSTCFASNNFFALRQMAVLGSGLTLLPAFLARDLISDGSLVQVFKEWAIEGSPVQILMPHQKETPKRIRKFVEFLAPRLSQYL